MNEFEGPFFKALFNTAVPRIILKADRPDFTIIAYNNAYRDATHTQNRDIREMYLWQAFDPNESGGDGGKVLLAALTECAEANKTVYMPPFHYDIPAADGSGTVVSWWQLEIEPVGGIDGHPEYLLVTTYNITEKVLNQQHVNEGKLREQNLNEEIAAINEELASSNEGLLQSNQELMRSERELLTINLELEQRVADRTKALSDSEELFRTIAQETDVLIAFSDETSNATYFNQAWINLTGRSMDELLKYGWADLIHAEDQEGFVKLYLTAFDKRVPFKGEFRVLAKDGTYHWLLAKGPPRFDANGTFIGYISSCVDITESKLQETELQAINEELASSIEELITANEELASTQQSLQRVIDDLANSEAQLRFVLNAIPQQVWTATPDGALDYVNKVVCDDFGYTITEIVGHGWQKFIHADDLPVCLERWVASLQSGHEYVVEFRLMFQDGSYKWHLARALPFFENGQVKLWLGTNTNIDFQKENEKRKDEFLSIASHELKTPVTSLKASLQLLDKMKDNPSPVMLNRLIGQSNRSVEKIITLIDELLYSSKIKEGQLHLSKSTLR